MKKIKINKQFCEPKENKKYTGNILSFGIS